MYIIMIVNLFTKQIRSCIIGNYLVIYAVQLILVLNEVLFYVMMIFLL